MVKFIGRTQNTATDATLSEVVLNSTTSTIIGAVLPRRIFFSISNPSNRDIWLKLQPAATDNDQKGVFIPRNGHWEMQIDNIYTGEISAISALGSPEIFITEY